MPLLPLFLAAIAPLHTFSGNDPAQWTRSVTAVQPAAAPADFHSFPCNASECSVARMVTDANRNTYVVGTRYFTTVLNEGLLRTSDVFVAKLDPAGALLFLATFSGKGNDAGRALALDSAGNIYVGGTTSSVNFPVRNAIQPERGTSTTGFVLKLSPDASQLIYSTYFGGTSSISMVNALAADAAGNVYVTGQTGSRDFPVTPGMPSGAATGIGPGGVFAAFVAKLNPAGDRILYSGRISGGTVACGSGSSCFLSMRNINGADIALDGAGNAYVAGNANVTDLPTTGGALARNGIGAWVARVKAAGTGLDYLTYLGAANWIVAPYANPGNVAAALAVDAAGNAYVVGKTNDPAFPATPGAVQTAYNGPADPSGFPTPPWDGFLAKLNPQGSAMIYATYLGGSANDEATAVAVDATGSAYVTGHRTLTDFLMSRESDFVYVVNPAGAALSSSSSYPRDTVSQALALDRDGRVRVAGSSGVISSFNPTAAAAPRLFGINSAAGRPPLGPAMAPGEIISLYGTMLGPEGGAVASAGPDGRMPFELGGTRVLIDGMPAPLLYAGRDQVNAVAPFGLASRNVRVEVSTAAGAAPVYPGVVIPSRPRIFTFSNGSAALNEDGTINSQANPARLGSIVSAWATGIGTVSPLPVDGEIPNAAQQYYCCEVSVGGKPADLLYSGAAPGVVAGMIQVNFRIPADLGAGMTQQIYFRLATSPAGPEDPAASEAWIWVRP